MNLEALDQKLTEFASLAKLTRAAESMIRKGSTKAQRGKVNAQLRHKSKIQRDHDELEVARKYHVIQTKGFREQAGRSAKLKYRDGQKAFDPKDVVPKRKAPKQISDEKSVVNLLVRSLKHEMRRGVKTKGAVERVRSTTVRGSTGEHGRMKILGSQTKNTGKWAETKVPKDKKGDFKIPRKNSKIVQSGREDRTGLPLKQYRTPTSNKIVRAITTQGTSKDPQILFPATGRRKVYGRPGMK